MNDAKRVWTLDRQLGSTCTLCNQPIISGKRRPDGTLYGQCRPCINAKRRRERAANPEKHRMEARLRHRNRRDLAVSLLGGRCVCCGEDNPMFLQFDHINNDGARDRGGRNRNGNGRFVSRIVGGDRSDSQLLCANCNTGKYRNGGVCPCAMGRKGAR